jgi:hypothetical protein
MKLVSSLIISANISQHFGKTFPPMIWGFSFLFFLWLNYQRSSSSPLFWPSLPPLHPATKRLKSQLSANQMSATSTEAEHGGNNHINISLLTTT